MQQKNQLLKFLNGRTYSIISLTQLTTQMVINIKENQIPHFVFQKVKYSQKNTEDWHIPSVFLTSVSSLVMYT